MPADQKDNEIQFFKALTATDEELIHMYIRGTNKFALREMKQRGLF